MSKLVLIFSVILFSFQNIQAMAIEERCDLLVASVGACTFGTFPVQALRDDGAHKFIAAFNLYESARFVHNNYPSSSSDDYELKRNLYVTTKRNYYLKTLAAGILKGTSFASAGLLARCGFTGEGVSFNRETYSSLLAIVMYGVLHEAASTHRHITVVENRPSSISHVTLASSILLFLGGFYRLFTTK